ncbi:MAG: Fe-S cluster assembly protein HesB [Microbacteriaceae bacterium]
MAVKNIAERSIGSETGGLRISASTDGSAGLAVAVTPEPAATDQVIESDGARVFLDETAAAVVGDKVLDAQVDGEGAVRFALAESV